MRHCKIPAGCSRPQRPCCVDCRDAACADRCKNHPGQCGCCEDGPPRRPGGHRPACRFDPDKMLRLHNQGLLQREIAARMGCSVGTVSAALRKLGVKRYG